MLRGADATSLRCELLQMQPCPGSGSAGHVEFDARRGFRPRTCRAPRPIRRDGGRAGASGRGPARGGRGRRSRAVAVARGVPAVVGRPGLPEPVRPGHRRRQQRRRRHARVAAVDPDAYVRRLDDDRGFGPAANEVLELVEGAAFYAFCHDDVALEPTAIRAMVEEAFRSNAGIATPKVVEWDDPTRLLYVGETADKTGRPRADRRAGRARPGAARCGARRVLRARRLHARPGRPVRRPRRLRPRDGDPRRGSRPVLAGAGRRALGSSPCRLRSSATCRPPMGRRPIPDHRLQVDRHRIRTLLDLLRAVPLDPGPAAGGGSGRRRHRLRVPDGPEPPRRRCRVRRGAGTSNGSARSGPTGSGWRASASCPTARFGGCRCGAARKSAASCAARSVGEDEALSPMASAGLELAGSLRSGPYVRPPSCGPASSSSSWSAAGNCCSGTSPRSPTCRTTRAGRGRCSHSGSAGGATPGSGRRQRRPPAFAMLGALGVVFLGAMSALRKVMLLVLLPVGVIGGWRLARGTGSLLGPARHARRVRRHPASVRRHRPRSVGRAAAVGGGAVVGARPRPAGGCTEVRPARRARALHDPDDLGLGIALAVISRVRADRARSSCWSSRSGCCSAGSWSRRCGNIAPAARDGARRDRWSRSCCMCRGRSTSCGRVAQWSAFGGVQSGARLAAGRPAAVRTGPVGGSGWGWAFLVVAALPLVHRAGLALRMGGARVDGRAHLLGAWRGLVSNRGSAMRSDRPRRSWRPPPRRSSLSAGLGLAAFQLDLPGYRFGWRQVGIVGRRGRARRRRASRARSRRPTAGGRVPTKASTPCSRS